MNYKNRIIGLEYVDAAELTPHPGNWRKHGKAQVDALRGVLSEVGIADALLAYRSERDGGKLTVIDGHLRKDAAPQTWPVLVLDVSDAEADYILATHDPLAAMADADTAALDSLLTTVSSDDGAVRQMLAELAAEAGIRNEPQGEDPGPQEDKAEELRERWGVVSGQMWLLDSGKGHPHKLICGDCTDPAVVARVMGGEKARVIVTSPPYADQREYQIGNFDWLSLANGMFEALPIGNPCDILVNLGLVHTDGKVDAYWQPWLEHCGEMGHPLYGWYVWDKGHGFPGNWNGRLAPSHEWIFHFSVGRVQANKWIEKADSSFLRATYAHNSAQRGRDGEFLKPNSPEAAHQPNKIGDSVIRVWRETEGVGGHPAVFPIELPFCLLQSWGEARSIVYEPFSGSGTTLIACEKLGRRCRAVEIDAGYVAVALERFFVMVGVSPVLLEAEP